MKMIQHDRTPDVAIKLLLFFLLVLQRVAAQDATATQTVMLQVQELNKIDLVGGSLTLQINRIDDAARGPNPAVDVSTKLLWTSNGESRKIAVASDVTSSRFVLKIQAERLSPGSGVAKPEVTLSDNEPHDLILGVQRAAGSCTLKFTALANAAEGTGLESHLITYTITGC